MRASYARTTAQETENERQPTRRSFARRSRVNAAVSRSASSSPSPRARRSVERRSQSAARSSVTVRHCSAMRLCIKACEPQRVTAAPPGSSTMTRRRASRAPHTAHAPCSAVLVVDARFLRSMPRRRMLRSARPSFLPPLRPATALYEPNGHLTSSPAAPASSVHRSRRPCWRRASASASSTTSRPAGDRTSRD